MFSVLPNADLMGGRERPAKAPVSKGLVKDAAKYIEVVPFNDADALERMFAEKGREIACLIMEPAMMNIGIVVPQPGYLQRVRALCDRYGVVFIFDEIKTGFTIAAGGATERFGVQPDLVCLAKAISAGLPAAAFGGRKDLMFLIEQGVSQMGTYNGNPLVAHVGLVALRELLTPAGYQTLARLGTRLATGCQRAIDAYGIPAHTVDLGAKGCVSYRPTPLRNYRDFLDTKPDLFAASYPVAPESRHLHDAGRRRAVDAVAAAQRRRYRPLHRGVHRVLQDARRLTAQRPAVGVVPEGRAGSRP